MGSLRQQKLNKIGVFGALNTHAHRSDIVKSMSQRRLHISLKRKGLSGSDLWLLCADGMDSVRVYSPYRNTAVGRCNFFCRLPCCCRHHCHLLHQTRPRQRALKFCGRLHPYRGYQQSHTEYNLFIGERHYTHTHEPFTLVSTSTWAGFVEGYCKNL